MKRSAPHARHRPAAFLTLAFLLGILTATRTLAQDWLTPLELEQFRETEGGDKRIAFYLKVIKLRIESASQRLAGKSSKPGDPLEFFSINDMANSCFQALRASMVEIQDQISYRHLRGPELVGGLKALKAAAKSLQPFFQNMQKVAIEKKDETLYKMAKDGLEYCDSALRGVETALKKYGANEPYLNR